MKIPVLESDLTSEWFTEALGEPVTDVRSEPLGVGVGLVGTLFRVTVETREGARTIIAKLAAPSEEGRFVATVLNMYGREVGFYNELSPRTPIRHPQCYYAAHDPATQDTVLLLEDVSPKGKAFDQVSGCTLEQAGAAIETLARLHAPFWDEDGLAAHDWLLHLGDEPYPSASAMAYEMAWPVVQEYCDDLIDDRVRTFGDEYGKRIAGIYAKLSEGPCVLSHADWRLDNLFFCPGGDVIAVDWQLIDRSVGPRDLSYLVTQSVEVEDPSCYRSAFEKYLSELRDLNVDVDPDWAWEMYRYGTLLGFVYPVVAGGALTVNDQRHIDLARALFRRSVAALRALDAFDLPT
jgi:hypothetical protein